MDERPHQDRLPEPLYTPEVPAWAEKLRMIDHVRLQFQPVFKNVIGGPDIDRATELVGIDIRCPICKHIQSVVPPNVEGVCVKCDLRYKYTVVKSSAWLWIWRPREALILTTEKK